MKSEKLPIAFKKQWVAALINGNYEQNLTGDLYRSSNNTYCCLGVAGIVCGINNTDMNHRAYLNSTLMAYTNNDKILDKVPELLKGDSGIPHELAKLNDDEVPFEVIAGVINEWL